MIYLLNTLMRKILSQKNTFEHTLFNNIYIQQLQNYSSSLDISSCENLCNKITSTYQIELYDNMLHDACNPHDIIDRNRYTWRLKVYIKQCELQCFPLHIKGNKLKVLHGCLKRKLTPKSILHYGCRKCQKLERNNMYQKGN